MEFNNFQTLKKKIKVAGKRTRSLRSSLITEASSVAISYRRSSFAYFGITRVTSSDLAAWHCQEGADLPLRRLSQGSLLPS